MTALVRTTYTFKRAGELALDADLHARSERLDGEPVVVWLHGGALIMGDRDTVPPWLLRACGREGWALVSIDYRLAPETRLPEILVDVQDAFAWLRRGGIDQAPSRAGPVAAIGESAGGYLALATGSRVRPRPSAIVSLWGYGDLVGEWYSRPSPHPVHHQIVMPREEALRQVSGPPVADGSRRAGDGYAFYQHCRQHGLWPEAVTGWDPKRERDRFEPFMPLGNVAAGYPPTLLIHGTEDTDVPYERSVEMAAALRAAGVDHRLIGVAGAEHGLDGADDRVVEEAFAEAVTFLRTRLVPDAG